MSWYLKILHYEDIGGTSDLKPTSMTKFLYETKAECVAAQDVIKYLTKYNGGEPVISSVYGETNEAHPY